MSFMIYVYSKLLSSHTQPPWACQCLARSGQWWFCGITPLSSSLASIFAHISSTHLWPLGPSLWKYFFMLMLDLFLSFLAWPSWDVLYLRNSSKYPLYYGNLLKLGPLILNPSSLAMDLDCQTRHIIIVQLLLSKYITFIRFYCLCCVAGLSLHAWSLGASLWWRVSYVISTTLLIMDSFFASPP